MCDCGNTDAGRYFARIGGQFGDLATSKAARLADYGKGRIKAWTGFGDYQIKTNSLINPDGRPNLGISTQGRSTFIRHREYIGDVYTHPTTVGAFNATTFVVNPANIATFPWLGTIANQFEQYKPRGIIFEFRSTATDTTTNASLGSIIMSTDYDLLDAAYSNKADMLNSAYSSEGKMTDDVLHGIECDPQELARKLFYTRAQVVNGTSTVGDRDYDVCKTTIATQGGGLAAGQSVGSLYIHYEFEFLKEQVYGGISGFNTLRADYKSTVAFATPVIENMGLVRQCGFDMGLTFASGGIVFPQFWQGATFRITFMYSQTVAGWVITTPTNLVYQGCAKVNVATSMQNGGGGWASYYAPFTGDTVSVGPGTSMGETYVKMNQPLTIPATMNWPATSTWGFVPSANVSPILNMIVEVIATNWNQQV